MTEKLIVLFVQNVRFSQKPFSLAMFMYKQNVFRIKNYNKSI